MSLQNGRLIFPYFSLLPPKQPESGKGKQGIKTSAIYPLLYTSIVVEAATKLA